MKIVLASESQFRKRAMDLLGIPYETRPARIDEKQAINISGTLRRLSS